MNPSKSPSQSPVTYADAGVSINAGNELVRRIKNIVAKGKKSPIGGFSGLFPLPGSKNLFLSGCCDGVGTKLKIAFLLNRHDTVGIDLVAMNVNDLLCTAAKPLFFLDYFACGKLNVDQAELVIRGIQAGCEQAGCVLLGGETAEMPGFYAEGEYDLAGFAVGMVEKKRVIDGRSIKKGDVVIGLASSGLHSNGYSLVRKVFSEEEQKSWGSVLIAPTRIYVKAVWPLLQGQRPAVKGMAHITGGGWVENIPRMLPKGVEVRVNKDGWPIHDIFRDIQKKAGISDMEMFRTFNMGIGLVLIVGAADVERVRKTVKECYVLGEVVKGSLGVVFEK